MKKDWNVPKLEVLDVKLTLKYWPKPPKDGGNPPDPDPEVPDLDS